MPNCEHSYGDAEVPQLTSHQIHCEPSTGKALQFFLRLRRPNVFSLIRENNLFTDVRDQALLLVEFDQELFEKRKKDAGAKGVQLDAEDATKTPGITLLVDHTHSIPAGFPSIPCLPDWSYLILDYTSGATITTSTVFFVPIPTCSLYEGPPLHRGIRRYAGPTICGVRQTSSDRLFTGQ